MNKPDLASLIYHAIKCMFYGGGERRKEEEKTRRVKGVRFIQGKGTSLRIPGLLLISVGVFGFQPSPAPISQSPPPQEDACCLPRHSSPTTGTAGRVFILWHWWDTQHARSHLPLPHPQWVYWDFKLKTPCREKQALLVVYIKSPTVSPMPCLL